MFINRVLTHWKFLLTACCILLGAADSLAEHGGRIVGSVTDSETGDPLPYVNVAVTGTMLGGTTSEAGIFSIEAVPPGTYRVRISSIGYETRFLDNIAVKDGDSVIVKIALSPLPVVTDEIVVTASRKSQSIKLSPASISTISALEIRNTGVNTFDEAFNLTSGVVVTRSSGANIQALSIRGASEVAGGGIGNRVLLLIDGRPAISPESGGALWNLVPVNSVNKIEIVKGAYSALYGSSAMGGVINIITKQPETKAQTTVHVNYGFYESAPKSAQYEGFHDFSTFEFSRNRKWEKFEYVFDVSRKADDGHREKSAFELYNLYSKFKFNFSRNRDLTLSGNFNLIDNDTPATWLSTKDAYKVAEHRKDDYQNRREINADLAYQAIAGSNLKYSSRLYYYQNFSEFTFNDDPANDSTNVNFGKQSIDRETIRAERLGNVTQLDVFAGSRHYLIAGVDLKYDNIAGLPDTVLYGRHKALHGGIYLQDEIQLSEKLTSTIGARYDYYEIISEFSESNFSPKIALVYKHSDDLAFRTLLAQAFRNPSMGERFIKFEQGGGLRFRPNPGLRAEKLALSAEIGVNASPFKNLSLDAALFYNKYTDLIAFQQVSTTGEDLTFQVINLKDAVMQGFEIQATYRPAPGLTLKSGYTFLDARDRSEGRFNDALPYKVRHAFTWSADWAWRDLRLNLNGRYRGAVEEVSIYPGSEPQGNALLNAKCSYAIREHYTVYAAIRNITYTLYEEIERYRMPGRNYTLGLYLNL